MARILVADDEVNLRRVLVAMLRRQGHEVVQASDGLDAQELLASDVDVLITDLRMPKMDGMDLLRASVARHPHVPVIMLTAYGSVGQAVEAIKLGAFDYIEKPYEAEQLREVIEKSVRQAAANRAAPRFGLVGSQDGIGTGQFGLVGISAPMQAIYEVLSKVAATPSTVLITGESGTGKELVAKALHEHSRRASGPFIKINCAAIPKTLIESELFGHEKGAFTGATGSKPGRFELADGGTLFLDEIGEIPVEMQVKLLRVLQESEFERVGGIKTLKVDVRLIAATNRDLEKEVAAGAFREDLFYRLHVVPMRVPPLRERTGDLPLLVEHIVKRFAERLGRPPITLTPAAMDRLCTYAWPGNIRELENVLERTMLLVDTNLVDADDLPLDAELAADGALPELGGDTSLKDIVRAETSRIERDTIARALDETGGNVTQAARLLRISRKGLQLKMKELGLRDREAHGA